MTNVRINGVRQRPADPHDEHTLTPERLRVIVQDSHINFLIGAGTPSSHFGTLGDIEDALTSLSEIDTDPEIKDLVRASILGHYFTVALLPNLPVIERDATAEGVLRSYATFLRTMNRILVKRHSSLLAKQANIFTTNMDMVFEVALEEMGIDSSDGFSGKIRPRFDLGEFKTLRFRLGSRYEHRSEVPVFNLYKLHGSAGWRTESTANGDAIYFDHNLELLRQVAQAHAEVSDHLLPIPEFESADPDETGMPEAGIETPAGGNIATSALDSVPLEVEQTEQEAGSAADIEEPSTSEASPPSDLGEWIRATIESLESAAAKTSVEAVAANEFDSPRDEQCAATELVIGTEEIRAFLDAYKKLGIVNPDKGKFATTVLNETYYELIRRFANELERENSVLFVHGFSFRDEHLRKLVVRAARTNPTLQVIVFCYSRADLDGYAALLPDADIKNGNVSYVAPRESEQQDIENGPNIDLSVLERQFFAPIVADKIAQPDHRIELDIRTPDGDGRA